VNTLSFLQVQRLSSGYGPLQVLFEVDLDIRAGEIVALMGSNGAGKTTTLRTITGQLRAIGGHVLFGGQDVTRVTPEALVRRGVALVPEGRGMLRDLTVEQNLQLGAFVVRERAVVRAAFARAYETFPILADRKQQLAGQLSGGQQQMLALARALMSNPRLLLVDEASLGLSPAMTETAFELLLHVNRTAEVALLLVEQNAFALELAERAFILEKGRIVDAAEGEAVRTMQRRLQAAYLGRPREASA
jgi:branched-chain amino acid transport system ATP-binding protein